MSATERTVTRLAAALICLGAISSPVLAQTAKPPVTRPAPAKADATRQVKRDLTTQPTLYTVGYAHLDTEWRWEYPQSISEYLPNTMHRNFVLFEKYPDYVFNFSGANRYRLMKEYWPADYGEDGGVHQGGPVVPRGFVNGRGRRECAIGRGDSCAVPVRQRVLPERIRCGRAWSTCFPDCFGFPWSLAEPACACGDQGFFDAEAGMGLIGAGPAHHSIWRDASRHPVQCRRLGWSRWQECGGGIQSRIV